MSHNPRIRHRTRHSEQHDVLDVGERFYTIPGVDLLPTVVPKEEYEPVPTAEVGWVDITSQCRVEVAPLGLRQGLFLGAKRIGYTLMKSKAYRLRLDGEHFVLERRTKS